MIFKIVEYNDCRKSFRKYKSPAYLARDLWADDVTNVKSFSPQVIPENILSAKASV
jgi:hypothetical protein